jgi:putative spermidine/putrescine transport system permease protein
VAKASAASRGKAKYALLLPALILIIAAFFIPMLLLFVVGFQTYVPGSGFFEHTFTLENFVRLFDSYHLTILMRTFKIAFLAALLSLVFGYPVALLLSRTRGKKKGLLLGLILTPLLTNVVARTLGLMIVFATHGPVNKLLGLFGIGPVQFIPGELGIILGLTQVFIPYMILSINSVLENLQINLQNAARDLGCSPMSAFWKVIFPLSTPGIVAGSLFVFLLSFSSFVTPRLLGGGKVMVMTMLVQQQAMQLLNWPFAAAAAIILMIFCVLLVTTYNRLTARIERMNDRTGIYGDSDFSSGIYRIIRGMKNLLYDLWCKAMGCKETDSSPLKGRYDRRWHDAAHHVGGVLYHVFTVLVLIFIVLPLPIVIISSFSQSSMILFPPKAYSTKWYTGLLAKREYITSFLLSLRIALLSVAVSLPVGTLAALAIKRFKYRFPELLKTLFLSPLMVPAVIIGIALMRFMNILGWINSFKAIFTAHVLLTTVYVIRTVLSSLVGYDITIEYAARDLGASPLLTFRRITLPLIKPGLIVAGMFAFITSLDETTISIFIAGGRTTTLPVRIYSMLEHGLDPTVTVVSSLLIVLALSILLLINKVMGLDKFKL